MRDDPERVTDTVHSDPHDAARRLGRILGLARRCSRLPARAPACPRAADGSD